MSIRTFYNDLLAGLNLTVDKEGLITLNEPDGTTTPAVIEGKRLIFPSKEVLRQGITEDLQPFHPLSESIARKGVSPVLTYLKKTAHAEISVYTILLVSKLMEVASDPSLCKDLPPTCSDYLKKVPNANEQTLKKLERLLRKATAKNALVTVYLKNGGKYAGKAVSRLCTIRFPIMDALDGPDMTIYGVKLTQKEKSDISALFHYVIPLGDDPEEYSAGSDAKVAPFLEAFLTAFGKITKQLNKMVSRFAEPLALPLPPFEQKYLKHLAKFPDYFSDAEIPSLRGNEGAVEKGTSTEEVSRPTAPTRGTSQPPWDSGTPTAPARSAAPKQETMQDWLARLNPQPQPTPVAQHVQQPQQSNMYIPSFQRQQYVQQPQPAPSPFRSAISATSAPPPPGVGGYGQPQHGYGQVQPQAHSGYGQPQSGYGNPPPRASFNMPGTQGPQGGGGGFL